MHFRSLFAAAFMHSLSGIGLAQSEHLNLTTIALVNGVSVFQCWQLNQTIVPTAISAPGPSGVVKNSTLGPLGDPVDATWLSVPGGTPVRDHPANAVE